MRAHISLNVKNVSQSVAFYQKVFGVAPQKMTSTYAKFDLSSPALNLSMVEMGPTRPQSRVNHFGIEVDSPEEIGAWKERLSKSGITVETEEATQCCYAKQDKVWFADPDNNAWEVFFVYEQLPVNPQNSISTTHRASPCGPGAQCC